MPKGHRNRLSSAEVTPSFGFSKGPPSVHSDIARQFRDNGYAVLNCRGPGLHDDNLCWPAAHRVLQTIWQLLGELFLHSGLLRQWWPICIVAKTQATMSINGCAGQITDPRSAYFFVGLHSGLFIHIADRLLRTLSDPRAFPELGDVMCEQAGRTGRLLEVMPHDPVREAAALAMATMAVAAVFAHEVVAYRSRAHLATALAFRPDTALRDRHARLRRTFGRFLCCAAVHHGTRSGLVCRQGDWHLSLRPEATRVVQRFGKGPAHPAALVGTSRVLIYPRAKDRKGFGLVIIPFKLANQ